MVMCPSSVAVQEKLYITPFDCKGRDFMCQLIEDANEYAYISTESFTDEEFSNFLRNTSINRKIDLRILSGATSMDFTDRIGNMFRDLLAQGIDVNTTDEEMHAKLIITDKTLAVSSINLNKMNLGFKKTRKYWRENTESIVICKDPDLIKLAKEEYLKVFRESHSVREKLYEKLEKTVKEVFKGAFRLHPDPDVRTLFARLILDKQLDVRKLAIKIGKTTKKLMDLDGRKKIKKEDFFAALTLLSLSQGKQSFEQLKREIDKVEGQIDLMAILDQLRSLRLIDEDTGYYKIGSEVSL
jgi:histone H3/H4